MDFGQHTRIGIIGLGYVGLPLAVEFARHFDTVGYDIQAARIAELRAGNDHTLEVDATRLAAAKRLSYTNDVEPLRSCGIYIVTVPTPIDEAQRPSLGPLLEACRLLARLLKPNDLVIFESTVYPGTTEEMCVPLLEQGSGLSLNKDFYCGYSPERINPGDAQRRVTDIVKLTSGSTAAVAETVDALYRTIIHAGTYKASSIRVAESAKVIENVQRDVNIALINELAIIFDRLNIDTEEVLAAASTKWNFLPFRPGLVGGHCISVDPYYLTHKAEASGCFPELILTARRINSRMGAYVADRVIRLMSEKRVPIVDARVLVLGFTFKENCPDLRNTRVIDIVRELELSHAKVDVYDPWLNSDKVKCDYSIRLINAPEPGTYDAMILAVAHSQFREWGAARMRALGKPTAIIFDVKSILAKGEADGRL